MTYLSTSLEPVEYDVFGERVFDETTQHGPVKVIEVTDAVRARDAADRKLREEKFRPTWRLK